MGYVRWLKEVNESDICVVGGKSARLGELISANFPVPNGFVITCQAYAYFVKRNRLEDDIGKIRSFLTCKGFDDFETLDQYIKKVHKLIDQMHLPDEMLYELETSYKQLNCCSVAVRSSSIYEDSHMFSFAGIYETKLNVMGIDDLVLAIKTCWKSAVNYKAIQYQSNMNIETPEIFLAVLIQEMVDAEVAGTLFTGNPLEKSNDKIIINANWGLGKATVDSIVTPDEYTILKADLSIVEQSILTKEKMIILNAQGDIIENIVPQNKQNVSSLDEKQLRALCAISVDMETLFQCSLDIEWAILDKKFYILQARPITERVTEPESVKWDSPIPNTRWTRTWRLGEWLYDPVSPLFKSLAIPILTTAREKGGIGHLHWRLPKCWCLKKPWYCIVNGYFYARAEVRIVSFILFLLTTVPRIESSIKRWQIKKLPIYLHKIDEQKKVTLQEMGDAEILSHIQNLCHDAGEWWYLMALNGGGAGFIEKILGKFVRKFISKDIDVTCFVKGYVNKLLEGQYALYDLVHSIKKDKDIQSALNKEMNSDTLLSLESFESGRRFLEKYHRYMEEYGYQIFSIDFIQPTLMDEPYQYMNIIKKYINDEVIDPREQVGRQAKLRDEQMQIAMEKIKGNFPLKIIFTKLLDRAKTLSIRRENTVYYFQQIWPLLRKSIIEIGHRLVKRGKLIKPEDIFYLDHYELKSLLLDLEKDTSFENISYIIEERKKLYEYHKCLTPLERIPNTVSAWENVKGPKFWGESALGNDGMGNYLKGIGVSAGFSVGSAKIVKSVDDFHTFQRGDILVAVTTTPAWTPLFSIASAIVTEVGGITSHASIVAREYGIPTVVATGNVTQKVMNGQLIKVDGGKGLVYY